MDQCKKSTHVLHFSGTVNTRDTACSSTPKVSDGYRLRIRPRFFKFLESRSALILVGRIRIRIGITNRFRIQKDKNYPQKLSNVRGGHQQSPCTISSPSQYGRALALLRAPDLVWQEVGISQVPVLYSHLDSIGEPGLIEGPWLGLVRGGHQPSHCTVFSPGQYWRARPYWGPLTWSGKRWASATSQYYILT